MERTPSSLPSPLRLVLACRVWEVAHSTLPACGRYLQGMCYDFLPAITRHGYYDPATGHEPPVGAKWTRLSGKKGPSMCSTRCSPVWGTRGETMVVIDNNISEEVVV